MMNNEGRKEAVGDIIQYKAQALIAAEELYYGKDIIEKIKNATTQGQIVRYLATGRRRMSEHGKTWDKYSKKEKKIR